MTVKIHPSLLPRFWVQQVWTSLSYLDDRSTTHFVCSQEGVEKSDLFWQFHWANKLKLLASPRFAKCPPQKVRAVHPLHHPPSVRRPAAVRRLLPWRPSFRPPETSIVSRWRFGENTFVVNFLIWPNYQSYAAATRFLRSIGRMWWDRTWYAFHRGAPPCRKRWVWPWSFRREKNTRQRIH